MLLSNSRGGFCISLVWYQFKVHVFSFLLFNIPLCILWKHFSKYWTLTVKSKRSFCQTLLICHYCGDTASCWTIIHHKGKQSRQNTWDWPHWNLSGALKWIWLESLELGLLQVASNRMSINILVRSFCLAMGLAGLDASSLYRVDSFLGVVPTINFQGNSWALRLRIVIVFFRYHSRRECSDIAAEYYFHPSMRYSNF